MSSSKQSTTKTGRKSLNVPRPPIKLKRSLKRPKNIVDSIAFKTNVNCAEETSDPAARKPSAKIAQDVLKDNSDLFLEQAATKRRIDYVLVFDDDEDEEKRRARTLFKISLEKRDLIMDKSDSKTLPSGKRHGFVKVHATDKALEKKAEELRVKLPLDKAYDPARKDLNFFEKCEIYKRNFGLSEDFAKEFNSRVYLYARFKRIYKDLYKRLGDNRSYFDPTHRIMFIWEILSEVTYDQTEEDKDVLSPNVDQLLTKGVYTKAYPLHDGDPLDSNEKIENIPLDKWNVRRLLHKHWGAFNQCFKEQPLICIKQYLGQKIAIYFAFIGLYTVTLIPPAIAGVISLTFGILDTQVNAELVNFVCSSNLTMCPTCRRCSTYTLKDTCIIFQVASFFANRAIVLFAIFMPVWSHWFLIMWKRKEAKLTRDWQDITISPFEERIRDDYILLAGTRKAKNPITEKTEPQVNPKKHRLRRILAMFGFMCTLGLMILLVLIMMFVRVQVVRFFNDALQELHQVDVAGFKVKKFNRMVGSSVAATLIAIIFLWFQYFYDIIAHKLTNLECPKTDSLYERSFVYKSISYKLLSYLGPLMYLSMYKGQMFFGPIPTQESFFSTEYCEPGGCIPELTVQITIMIFVIEVWNTIYEICGPILQHFKRSHFDFKWKGILKRWEKDLILVKSRFPLLAEEYEELALQFSLVTMFSAAFPLLPLLALLQSVIEIRCDARKWTLYYRRPVPSVATDIGPWYTVFRAISFLAIIVNGIIVAFVSDVVPQLAHSWLHEHHDHRSFLHEQLVEYEVPKEKTFEYLNVTSCYFVAYRNGTAPFEMTNLGLSMTHTRWVVFAVYLILVNFLRSVVSWTFSEKPEKVDIEIKRELFKASVLFQEEDIRYHIKHHKQTIEKSAKPQSPVICVGENLEPKKTFPEKSAQEKVV